MRRIDRNKIKQDKKWEKKARTAAKKVAEGASVNDFSGIWGATKARLKDVSKGKCWYCEARQGRSDNAVDHYRPKSIYPWLAFELANFRYTCTFCNSIRTDEETNVSRGKGDNFPLLSGGRATKSSELAGEDRVLLDPCVSAEPGLLDFLGDGRACPRYPKEQRRCSRAEQSIRYYHLDHSELVEARRRIALQIADWVEGADAIYNAIDQGDPNSERAFSALAESLCRAIGEDAEYSVFSRRMLEGYRDRPWVEDILRCA